MSVGYYYNYPALFFGRVGGLEVQRWPKSERHQLAALLRRWGEEVPGRCPCCPWFRAAG